MRCFKGIKAKLDKLLIECIEAIVASNSCDSIDLLTEIGDFKLILRLNKRLIAVTSDEFLNFRGGIKKNISNLVDTSWLDQVTDNSALILSFVCHHHLTIKIALIKIKIFKNDLTWRYL
jgi:hypothetical protein